MASGPVVAMVWQGLDAVKTGRVMLGATNPLASPIGESALGLPSLQLLIVKYRLYPWRLRPRCWP